MLNRVRALLLLSMLLVLPLAASAQQLVAPISIDMWKSILVSDSYSIDLLQSTAAQYARTSTKQFNTGDRINGLKNGLIALSINKYLQNHVSDEAFNDAVARNQEAYERAGIDRQVILASESSLVAHLTKQYSVTHQYNVNVFDVTERPLVGAIVQILLEANALSSQTVRCTTDEFGRCPPVRYEISRDPSFTYTYSKRYLSTAKAEATKDGYYSASAVGQSIDSLFSTNGITELRLKMIRPVDYLDDDFAATAADRELRDRVLRFLDIIRLQSILVDAEVMLKGIGVSKFKDEKYLRLRINSTTTYNSLKLNRYDMGKRLFDETVRKVLTPLNDNIAASKAYYGYDIVVYGHTKSFAEESAVADDVEYRFLLPKSAVRRYKEKDISGQALLDAGVQLMDDERVELKLQ